MLAIGLVALSLAPGCANKKNAETKSVDVPTATSGGDPTLGAGSGTSVGSSGDPASDLPWTESRQLILGVSSDWDAFEITLQRFERKTGDHWSTVGEPWTATLGRGGLGWGIGLHGTGVPKGTELDKSPIKVEGDGKSAAGMFAIGAAFGYAGAAPVGTKVSYTQLDADWRCVDDSKSVHYNRVLEQSKVSSVDWNSAETMRRRDELYRWVILIDHNRLLSGGKRSTGEAARAEVPHPGGGSCIFFHVWREPTSPTVGCAAMEPERIKDLITWLDPDEKPIVGLLPQSQYRILRDSWRLPVVSTNAIGGQPQQVAD